MINLEEIVRSFFATISIFIGLLGSLGLAAETAPLSELQARKYNEAYRLLREQTGITFEGPFRRGIFRPKELVKPRCCAQKGNNRIVADFDLLGVSFREGTYEDSVGISFTFKGAEDPNRKMLVRLAIYDAEGTVIAGTTMPFGDQRIAAREWNATGSMFHMDPTSSLSTRLDGKTKRTISDISRIEISAVEMYDEPSAKKEPGM